MVAKKHWGQLMAGGGALPPSHVETRACRRFCRRARPPCRSGGQSSAKCRWTSWVSLLQQRRPAIPARGRGPSLLSFFSRRGNTRIALTFPVQDIKRLAQQAW